MDTLFLLLLPVFQLGVSGYLAVATLSAAIVLIRCRRQLIAGASHAPWVALIPLLMIPSLFFGFGTDPVQNILRVGREAICAVLMIWIVHGATLKPVWFNEKSVIRIILILVTGFLGLTAVQFFALRSGIYIGFPLEYFNNQTALVPSEFALRFSKTRPQATFSEPSYFGLVLLSLLLIASQVSEAPRARVAVLIIGMMAGLLCQAASFIVFALLLALYQSLSNRVFAAKHAMLVILPLITLLMLPLGGDWAPMQRFALDQLANDHSLFVRLLGPLQIMADYLRDHPFGLPGMEVADALYTYVAFLRLPPESFLANGAVVIFFQYGIFGLPILIALLWAPKVNLMRIYLIAAMFQNGNMLGPDKLAIVCFTICLASAPYFKSNEWKRRARLNAQVGQRVPMPRLGGAAQRAG